MTECCTPKVLCKDITTKNNIIVALLLYITGELMVVEAEMPPIKMAKSKPMQKKYKKRAKPHDDELDVVEFVQDEEDEEQQLNVVPPSVQMSSGVLTSGQNKIRENIVKTKLVHKGQLFHLQFVRFKELQWIP